MILKWVDRGQLQDLLRSQSNKIQKKSILPPRKVYWFAPPLPFGNYNLAPYFVLLPPSSALKFPLTFTVDIFWICTILFSFIPKMKKKKIFFVCSEKLPLFQYHGIQFLLLRLQVIVCKLLLIIYVQYKLTITIVPLLVIQELKIQLPHQWSSWD